MPRSRSIGPASSGDARSVDADIADADECGLTVVTLDEIASAEARLLDPTSYEDMSASHKRYRKRGGSQEACALPSDRTIPAASATPERWTQFHQERIGTGGFDPLTIIRKAAS